MVKRLTLLFATGALLVASAATATQNSSATPVQIKEDETARTRTNASVPVRGKEAEAKPAAEPTHSSDGPIEFQDFVARSVGRRLPILGSNWFAQVPSTFAPVDRIPVTADYVIGPGDEVVVRAWGQIDVDVHAIVDRTGDVYLPQIGTLHVAGIKFQQLHDFMTSAVGRTFRNFELSVNLGQLRSIQVFVTGQARRPGMYTVSSLSTLVNALFACGGPSSIGSMRHIQLKRGGNVVVTEFDLYDLLLDGDKSKDVPLLPGDVIFIPPVGKLVALAGSVNVAGIYELRGDASLGSVLKLAGGLTNVASGQKAIVERVYERTTRRVEEFNLDPSGLARPLQDGDLVKIAPLSPKFENAVTLRGNVALPGRYPWHAGMRVRDLVPTREALIRNNYWNAQNAAGDNNGTRPELAGPTSSLPEINWEYALVTRMAADDLTNRLMPFNLGHAIGDANSDDNLELRAGDVVTIFSQADLRVPMSERSKFVYLEGEFKPAGVYRVEPGETLRNLALRVGRLSPNAYLYAAEFTRNATRDEQRKSMDKIIVRMEKELDVNATQAAGRQMTVGDQAAIRARQESQRDLVQKLRQVEPTGRIVLDLRPSDASLDRLPDIELEDGDHLFVPSRSSVVSVVGEVNNSGSYIYKGDKRVGDYLKQAGGPTRYADRGNIFLLHPDGSVLPKKMHAGLWPHGSASLEDMKPLPGDTIMVPQHFPTTSVVKELKDWSQIFSGFALGAAAAKVLGQ